MQRIVDGAKIVDAADGFRIDVQRLQAGPVGILGVAELFQGDMVDRYASQQHLHRGRLDLLMVRHEGSPAAPSEIAQNSRGLPGRVLGMARGTVENVSLKVLGEEVNLAPLLLLVAGGFIFVRVVGISLSDPAMYLLGGMGMAVAMYLRFVVYQGRQE